MDGLAIVGREGVGRDAEHDLAELGTLEAEALPDGRPHRRRPLRRLQVLPDRLDLADLSIVDPILESMRIDGQ